MTGIMNAAAWEKIIRENLEWLMQQPRSLERDHTQNILEWARRNKKLIDSTADKTPV
jgi:hypothetical protein